MVLKSPTLSPGIGRTIWKMDKLQNGHNNDEMSQKGANKKPNIWTFIANMHELSVYQERIHGFEHYKTVTKISLG